MRILARARLTMLCSNALRRLKSSWRAIGKTKLSELEDSDDNADDQSIAVGHRTECPLVLCQLTPRNARSLPYAAPAQISARILNACTVSDFAGRYFLRRTRMCGSVFMTPPTCRSIKALRPTSLGRGRYGNSNSPCNVRLLQVK